MGSHQPSPRVAPIAMMAPHPESEPSRPSIEGDGSGPGGIASIAAPPPPARALPPRDVDAATIEDRYVQFILCCNPSVPGGTDTAELRKGFQALPRTDGKTFQIFTLFQLVEKLENKTEIETWSQLVVVMGVEPPDISKNQSTQKVQQYAVRLKRWLHAYHIDAYFHYLLGKPHAYYTDIPPASVGIAASSIRDGVPPEDDLALRAMLPEWRPKRGRRKLEPGEEDPLLPAAKRAERATSLAADPAPGAHRHPGPHAPAPVPHPATAVAMHYPASAFPWDRQSNQTDPWTAAQRAILPRPQGPPAGAGASGGPPPASQAQLATPPQQTHLSTPPQPPPPQPLPPGSVAGTSHPAAAQHTFWVDLPPDAGTPYPQSALDALHSAHPTSAFPTPHTPHPHGPPPPPPPSATADPGVAATPQSAHPTSAHPSGASPRPRKRHGPSVSAAWPRFAGGAAGAGKLRGRPPTNRSVQDGPYSTFPSKPAAGLATPAEPAPPAGTPLTATPASAFPHGAAPPSLPPPPPPHLQPAPSEHVGPGAVGAAGPTPPPPPPPPPIPEPLSAVSASSEGGPGGRRASKMSLSLQVPRHQGRPVRLATPPPPPTVLVNGGTAAGAASAASQPAPARRTPDPPAAGPPGARQRAPSAQTPGPGQPPSLPPSSAHPGHRRKPSGDPFASGGGGNGGGGGGGWSDEDEDEALGPTDVGGGGGAGADGFDDYADGDEGGGGGGGAGGEEPARVWKRRALATRRRLQAVEAELRAVKRRVMEAVM